MVLLKLKGMDGYEIFKRYVKRRIAANKNCLIFTAGPTGSGKSFAQQRMAADLDPKYNIAHTAFNPEQFMSIINSGELKGKGRCIIYDEVGVTFSSRNWYSVTNKMLHYFLQTCRSQNHILFFNSPDFNFLDVGARKLFHVFMQTVSINHENKTCSLKPFFIQYNMRRGKTYYKYLRVRAHKGYGGIKKIKRVCLSIPDANLIEEYERKKDRFTSDLNKEIYLKIQHGNRKALTEKQQEWYDLYKMGLTVEEIAKKLGVNERTSQYYQQRIIIKGYSLEKPSKRV